MKHTYTVDINEIEVVGRLWEGSRAAYKYTLNAKQVAEIGEPTRENVEMWLNPLNAGDFESILDFHAIIGEVDIPWAVEESECIYSDCMEPALD